MRAKWTVTPDALASVGDHLLSLAYTGFVPDSDSIFVFDGSESLPLLCDGIQGVLGSVAFLARDRSGDHGVVEHGELEWVLFPVLRGVLGTLLRREDRHPTGR